MSSITLTQLARQLGLGKSTVQRALSGTGRVSTATRQRVLNAAEEAGYHRNLVYAALVAQRKRSGRDVMTIHYICLDLPRSDPRSQGKVETQLLQKAAQGYGMQVEFVDPSKEQHPQSLVRRLWNRGSAGILLGNAGPEFLKGLRDFHELPVLNLQPNQLLPYHAIGFDVAKAVQMCWERLRTNGYQRIGFALMQHSPQLPDDFRRLSTAQALQETELPQSDRIPILIEAHGKESAIRSWLQAHRPDAVIAFTPAVDWFCQSAPGGPIPCVTLHANTRPENRHIPGTAQPWEIHATCAIRQIDLMIRSAQNGPQTHRHTLLIDPLWYASPL